MESQLKISILFYVLDCIPYAGHYTNDIISSRKAIELNNLFLEAQAMIIDISRDIIVFTADLDRFQCMSNLCK